MVAPVLPTSPQRRQPCPHAGIGDPDQEQKAAEDHERHRAQQQRADGGPARPGKHDVRRAQHAPDRGAGQPGRGDPQPGAQIPVGGALVAQDPPDTCDDPIAEIQPRAEVEQRDAGVVHVRRVHVLPAQRYGNQAHRDDHQRDRRGKGDQLEDRATHPPPRAQRGAEEEDHERAQGTSQQRVVPHARAAAAGHAVDPVDEHLLLQQECRREAGDGRGDRPVGHGRRPHRLVDTPRERDGEQNHGQDVDRTEQRAHNHPW